MQLFCLEDKRNIIINLSENLNGKKHPYFESHYKCQGKKVFLRLEEIDYYPKSTWYGVNRYWGTEVSCPRPHSVGLQQDVRLSRLCSLYLAMLSLSLPSLFKFWTLSDSLEWDNTPLRAKSSELNIV